ncbi:hypothetical protein [Metamycoplasma hominis]|uniref:hypothetical protein n=1 Tax=Metamycoplasma hominis TaxID=2098 RepID=UPI001CC3A8A8|nr:hypothetical protein [Metamycoplasma hominis]
MIFLLFLSKRILYLSRLFKTFLINSRFSAFHVIFEIDSSPYLSASFLFVSSSWLGSSGLTSGVVPGLSSGLT